MVGEEWYEEEIDDEHEDSADVVENFEEFFNELAEEVRRGFLNGLGKPVTRDTLDTFCPEDCTVWWGFRLTGTDEHGILTYDAKIVIRNAKEVRKGKIRTTQWASVRLYTDKSILIVRRGGNELGIRWASSPAILINGRDILARLVGKYGIKRVEIRRVSLLSKRLTIWMRVWI